MTFVKYVPQCTSAIVQPHCVARDTKYVRAKIEKSTLYVNSPYTYCTEIVYVELEFCVDGHQSSEYWSIDSILISDSCWSNMRHVIMIYAFHQSLIILVKFDRAVILLVQFDRAVIG